MSQYLRVAVLVDNFRTDIEWEDGRISGGSDGMLEYWRLYEEHKGELFGFPPDQLTEDYHQHPVTWLHFLKTHFYHAEPMEGEEIILEYLKANNISKDKVYL